MRIFFIFFIFLVFFWKSESANEECFEYEEYLQEIMNSDIFSTFPTNNQEQQPRDTSTNILGSPYTQTDSDFGIFFQNNLCMQTDIKFDSPKLNEYSNIDGDSLEYSELADIGHIDDINLKDYPNLADVEPIDDDDSLDYSELANFDFTDDIDLIDNTDLTDIEPAKLQNCPEFEELFGIINQNYTKNNKLEISTCEQNCRPVEFSQDSSNLSDDAAFASARNDQASSNTLSDTSILVVSQDDLQKISVENCQVFFYEDKSLGFFDLTKENLDALGINLQEGKNIFRFQKFSTKEIFPITKENSEYYLAKSEFLSVLIFYLKLKLNRIAPDFFHHRNWVMLRHSLTNRKTLVRHLDFGRFELNSLNKNMADWSSQLLFFANIYSRNSIVGKRQKAEEEELARRNIIRKNSNHLERINQLIKTWNLQLQDLKFVFFKDSELQLIFWIKDGKIYLEKHSTYRLFKLMDISNNSWKATDSVKMKNIFPFFLYDEVAAYSNTKRYTMTNFYQD